MKTRMRTSIIIASVVVIALVIALVTTSVFYVVTSRRRDQEITSLSETVDLLYGEITMRAEETLEETEETEEIVEEIEEEVIKEAVETKEVKVEEDREKDVLRGRISSLVEEVNQLKKECLESGVAGEEKDEEIANLKVKVSNLLEEIKQMKERYLKGSERSVPSGEYQKETDVALKTLLKSTFPGDNKWRDVTFYQGNVFPLKFYQDNFDQNLARLSPGKFVSFLSAGVRGYVWTSKDNKWSLVPIIVATDSSKKLNVYYYTREGLIKAIGDKEITPYVSSASLFD